MKDSFFIISLYQICPELQPVAKMAILAKFLQGCWRNDKSEYINPATRALKCLQIWRKQRIWRKSRFWRNFAEVVDEMIIASKLTQLEGSWNAGRFGKNGEFGKSGDFGKISPKVAFTKLSEYHLQCREKYFFPSILQAVKSTLEQGK